MSKYKKYTQEYRDKLPRLGRLATTDDQARMAQLPIPRLARHRNLTVDRSRHPAHHRSRVGRARLALHDQLSSTLDRQTAP